MDSSEIVIGEIENPEESYTDDDVSVSVRSHSSSDDYDDEDFEFAFVSTNAEFVDIADDLFTNGQIRPIYPVFNRNWDATDLNSSFDSLKIENEPHPVPLPTPSSSGLNDLESAPMESYCVWSPAMGPPPLDPSKKSRSTGASSSKKWSLRELVMGRSYSDGKQKFLFLAPPNTSSGGGAVVAGKKKVVIKKKERTTAGASNLCHGKGGKIDQKSYLPYRRDRLGFFGAV